MVKLNKLCDNVYYSDKVTETDRPILGYIEGKKYSVMVDCGNSRSHLVGFVEQLEKRYLSYPRYALITHWHWDHTFGMHAFLGDRIVSSLTNEKLKQMKEWKWDEESVQQRLASGEEIEFAYNCMKNEYGNLKDIRVTAGDIIFNKGLTLNLGGIHCQIIQAGGPHEPDSCVVLVQERGILFAGDAHSVDYYHGEVMDKKKLLNYIQFLERLPFHTYIHSHVEPVSKEEILKELKAELIDNRTD